MAAFPRFSLFPLFYDCSLEHVALIFSVIDDNELYLYLQRSGNGRVLKFAETPIPRYGHEEANYWLALEWARRHGQASGLLAMLRGGRLRELTQPTRSRGCS
jgi:hypothetical protein